MTDTIDFDRLYRTMAASNDAGEEYERIVRRVYERILGPGDTAVDVGAHSGKHTLPLALSVAPQGRVVAIEPIRQAYDTLQRRVTNAGLAEVVSTINGCVSNEEGTATFSVIPDHFGWSSLAPRTAVTNAVEIEVAQHTLDGLCESAGTVAFVKIDVEGAEPDVLAGAATVLDRDRPVVHVEVVPSALSPFDRTTADVADPLRERGYRLFDLLGNDVTEPSTWEASSTVPVMADYLAVHESDDRLDSVLDELSRSFAPERSDRTTAPTDLAPPPTTSRERHAAAPRRDRLVMSAIPLHHTRAPAVRSVEWPEVGFVGRSQRLVIGRDDWSILNRTTGDVSRHVGRAVVGLPIDSFGNMVRRGDALRLSVSLVGNRHAGTATIAELHWPDTDVVTLVRSRRDKRVELLWLRNGRPIAAAGADRATAAADFEIEILAIGNRIEATCRADADRLETTVPRSAVGTGEVNVSIGRRRRFAQPDQVNAVEARASFSLSAVGLATRARSDVQRTRRVARRGPRQLVSAVVRRIRRLLA